MGDFHRCIDFILAEEGGYVNHPTDPGGETNFGISKRAYPGLDIKALTRISAIDLYRRDYWTPIQGDDLPPGLDLVLLDTAVNMGVRTAIKLLQRALNLSEDGVMGKLTLTAAQNALPRVLTDFCAERALRYEFNANEATFGRGWYRRLFRVYGHAQRFTP
ncbi:MAG: hypothetical protein QG599_2585 [Pseudomonadota bacterium]|nr:hypothetical protein [Pseudomonadota bacterium]